MGIRAATVATAAASSGILAGILAIKSDPTARFTLILTAIATVIALIALVAVILVPSLQHTADVQRSLQAEKAAAIQHSDDARKLDALRTEIREFHADSIVIDRHLIRIIERKR